MLVLTRKVGETLIIGDEIVVKVLSTGGNQVRIGITAPKEVSVYREEIYRRIQDQPKQTALIGGAGLIASKRSLLFPIVLVGLTERLCAGFDRVQSTTRGG